jgi:hypothetical protein
VGHRQRRTRCNVSFHITGRNCSSASTELKVRHTIWSGRRFPPRPGPKHRTCLRGNAMANLILGPATVSKPLSFRALEICLSEEQTPQVIVSSRSRQNIGERLERAFVRPRQARPFESQ